MHLKWRGLELPARVIPEASSRTETFCRFSVEPFERGFGTTVGNSLRRILLSSVEGAAVTRIRLRRENGRVFGLGAQDGGYSGGGVDDFTTVSSPCKE